MKTHIQEILRRLQARNRVQAAWYEPHMKAGSSRRSAWRGLDLQDHEPGLGLVVDA
ncbi:MAG: hypothetical protein ACXVH3_38645 [Solirubrobacteraceae bacterium]